MLLHIFKMIWQRKKANSLIMSEIAIAFVVVFAIAVIAIRQYSLYQVPLGFDYHNMWQVRLSTNAPDWNMEKDQSTLKHLVNLLRQQPEIDKVQLLRAPTFKNWNWTSSSTIGGKNIEFGANKMDDGSPETYKMTLLNGRWFGEQDANQNYIAVIVNRRFAEQAFSHSDAIGKNIADDDNDGKETEKRIVGVFENFRQSGELSKLKPYVIYRYDLEKGDEYGRGIYHLSLKVKPNITAAYEEKLFKLLKSAAPIWDFGIDSWELQRQTQLKQSLLPMIVLSIVGIFLLLMAAMGLFGVLWQNVTSRTQEIGLRRAMGATATNIHGQIIGELILISLFAMFIALLVLIQLPLLGVFEQLNWQLFIQGFFVSSVFMLALATLCAYYPGKIATAFMPADALHYE